MSTPTKKILVPTDFTKVADCAVNHANVLAARMNAEIHLMHIVSDKDDVEEARTKLNMMSQRMPTIADGDSLLAMRVIPISTMPRTSACWT